MAQDFFVENFGVDLARGIPARCQGHHAHAELVQKEAAGEKSEYSLLLMHAEDQLMSAEAFGILAEEFVDVYKMMEK